MNPSHYPQMNRGSRTRSRSPEDQREEQPSSMISSNASDQDGPESCVTMSGNHLRPPRSRSTRKSTNVSRLQSMFNDNSDLSDSDTDSTIRGAPLQEPVSSLNIQGTDDFTPKYKSSYTPYMEDKLRRKLKFFFMDPFQKWRARRRVPWKLTLQVIKVILVTAQLVVFGEYRSKFVDYVERNSVAMRHLLLKDWDPAYETLPYPPATGEYAIYSRTALIEHLDFAFNHYNTTPDEALGAFYFDTWQDGSVVYPVLCKTFYQKGQFFDNDTYVFDSSQETVCFTVYPNSTGKYDIQQFMKNINESLHFPRLIGMELKVSYRTVDIELDTREEPICFRLNISIHYDNDDMDGQIIITLDTTLQELRCKGHVDNKESEPSITLKQTIFDIFVIIISLLSFLLCVRSLIRAYKLKRETVQFFSKRFGKKLIFSDRLEFLNLWFVLIITNDVLTVIGSSIKIQIENRKVLSSSSNFDLCGIMLGTGSLLAWFGVLRYLQFFKKYNILILTLKKASPNVARFMLCTLMLYFGFTFLGWVVLGPYHIKFRHLSTSSECLFSLVNGDDMFVTFSALETKSNLIWYYSRVYLYSFISLFIYVVLSLFIAVIMDTYETIKNYYEVGFAKTDLHTFIAQCKDSPNSGIYRKEANGSCDLFTILTCCCRRPDPDKPNEYTSLIS